MDLLAIDVALPGLATAYCRGTLVAKPGSVLSYLTTSISRDGEKINMGINAVFPFYYFSFIKSVHRKALALDQVRTVVATNLIIKIFFDTLV